VAEEKEAAPSEAVEEEEEADGFVAPFVPLAAGVGVGVGVVAVAGRSSAPSRLHSLMPS
jgi:hypothetical protein